MAKFKKDFNKVLQAKPTDATVKKVAEEIHTTKPLGRKNKKFNVILPMNLYEKLKDRSDRRGVSMKNIIVEALWDKLED
jgi:hypothetical protein